MADRCTKGNCPTEETFAANFFRRDEEKNGLMDTNGDGSEQPPWPSASFGQIRRLVYLSLGFLLLLGISWVLSLSTGRKGAQTRQGGLGAKELVNGIMQKDVGEKGNNCYMKKNALVKCIGGSTCLPNNAIDGSPNRSLFSASPMACEKACMDDDECTAA